jgi:hypothetical protein
MEHIVLHLKSISYSTVNVDLSMSDKLYTAFSMHLWHCSSPPTYQINGSHTCRLQKPLTDLVCRRFSGFDSSSMLMDTQLLYYFMWKSKHLYLSSPSINNIWSCDSRDGIGSSELDRWSREQSKNVQGMIKTYYKENYYNAVLGIHSYVCHCYDVLKYCK